MKDKGTDILMALRGEFRNPAALLGVISTVNRVTQKMNRGEEGFERMKRCVDEMLFFDSMVEDQFSEVGKVLQTMSYWRRWC